MAKKDKKKDDKAEKGEKKTGGIFGRIFGGGKAPSTPKEEEEAMDAPTIPPGEEELLADAKTIPPADREEASPFDDAGEARTLPPFAPPSKKGGKAAEPDPFDDPAEARTLPPFPASKKGGKAAEPDPFDDPAEARTLPPFNPPKGAAKKPGGKAPPPPSDDDIFASEGVTLAPTPRAELEEDIPLDAPTLAPQHLKGQVPPKKGRAREDEALTQDPLLTPAPKDLQNKDPFAFEDDILGEVTVPPQRPAPGPPARGKSPAPPARAGGPKAPAPVEDELGFGSDVPDLLATPESKPKTMSVQREGAPPAEDPFGAALADDPFDSGPRAPVPPPPNKTDELELTPSKDERDEKTLEMDAPPVPEAKAKAKAAPPPPRKKTLFASQSARPDGSRRFGQPAAEVQVDHDKATLFAPSVEGGWSEVPPFAALLADGSVVGRLPKGVKYEPDGSFTVPAPPPRREPQAGPEGMRFPAFPAGMIVDRERGFVYAAPDLAELLAGSPETVIRLEDGGAVVSLPAAAKWNDDGSYTVPGAKAAGPAAASEKAASPHGRVVFEARYLGCEETVYEDGWAALKLPKAAKVEGELVTLPASSRLERGAVPELLEVETRPDGSLALRLPAGYVPEGDVAWLPPPEIAPREEGDPVETDWGEPTEELDYCGIHESAYANGWVRLDLPPGARVARGRVLLPREYAAAADARTLAWFDRDADGSLVFSLPQDAEPLGGVVLLPPEGARAFAASLAPAPEPLRRPASESVLPPGGGGTVTKTKGLDRFRNKKSDEPSAEAPKSEEAPPSSEKDDDEGDEGAESAQDSSGSGGRKRKKKG